jgi:hypothetical protein
MGTVNVVDKEPLDRRGHVPPPPGLNQPLHPSPDSHREQAPRQGGGGAGFVTVNNRLFAPLQGLNPNNILMGGYGWLSSTDGGATLHPGLDLNSGGGCNDDEGALVVTPLAGVVRATLSWNGYSSGEGNHVWVELDDPCLPGPTWWHTDHLERIDCSVGQRLAPGAAIGTCGRTGGWDCSHAHTELLTGPPQDGYWQWPYGWSRASVEAAYWSPSSWWDAATALVLAESQQPIPPEVVMLLEDWQVVGWVLSDLYKWAGIELNPESGTAKSWVLALREGTYLGRPRTGERQYGGGTDDEGVWVEYDHGCLWYRLRDGAWSVTG